MEMKDFWMAMTMMMKAIVCAQSCLTLRDPMDCSPPGPFVHGISWARILEWVAISFSRGSSQPMAQTYFSCLAGGFFPTEPPGKPSLSGRTYLYDDIGTYSKSSE